MSSVETRSADRSTVAKAAVFLCITAVWIFLDQFTKSRFAGMEPGGIIAGPFAGIFDIRLVHNTGGAWGILSDSTFALGVFSIVVCLVLAVFFFVTIKDSNMLQTVSFA